MVEESKRKTDKQWQALLDRETYEITRLKGTERPFTGRYWDTDEPGLYRCTCCHTPLFWSDAKYDAGCGWPSFFQVVNDTAIVTQPDHSHNMTRVEIVCQACDSHLGHVFEDGPQPTGLRYCVNSASIELDTSTTPLNT